MLKSDSAFLTLTPERLTSSHLHSSHLPLLNIQNCEIQRIQRAVSLNIRLHGMNFANEGWNGA